MYKLIVKGKHADTSLSGFHTAKAAIEYAIKMMDGPHEAPEEIVVSKQAETTKEG